MFQSIKSGDRVAVLDLGDSSSIGTVIERPKYWKLIEGIGPQFQSIEHETSWNVLFGEEVITFEEDELVCVK